MGLCHGRCNGPDHRLVLWPSCRFPLISFIVLIGIVLIVKEIFMNQLINLFKLLSDESRLRIIMMLYHQELCVCQLTGILDLSQPTISKNLSKLRDLNLVKDTRKEKFVFYSLNLDNKVFIKLLDDIAETIELYPQLVLDKSRLSDKDIYLNQCCNPVL